MIHRKNTQVVFFAIIFTLLFGLSGLSSKIGQAETLGFSLSKKAEGEAAKNLQVTVVDDISQAPLPDAQILVADTLDSRTALFERQANSNSGGEVKFTDLGIQPKAVTVSKTGYETLSIVGIQTLQVTVFLKPLLNLTPQVVVHGNFGGWNPPPGRKNIEAGMVFRTLNAMDMLDFQVSSFFSPLKDTIDVYGKREIPSNLTFPDQEVSVFLGSIRLNKPDFRLPLSSQRPVHLAGIQCVGKISELMSGMQGSNGPSADLLNKLGFQKVALTEVIQPSDGLHKDFDATLDLVPNQYQVTVNPAPFVADVVVVSALDMEGNRQVLLPTDLKTAATAEDPSNLHPVSLAGPAHPIAGAVPDVLTVALSKKQKQISGIVTDQAPAQFRAGDFLATDELADFKNLPESIQLKALSHSIGVVSFDRSIPRVTENSENIKQLIPIEIKKEAYYPIWTIYTLPQAGTTSIPTKNLPTGTAVRKYSVSQLDFGSSFDESSIDGMKILRQLERFSRATAFQSN